jgi:hypothetical protein
MDFIKENAGVSHTEGTVTISIKDYAELIRYKTFLELFLSTHDKARSWANSDIVDAIKERLTKETMEEENA